METETNRSRSQKKSEEKFRSEKRIGSSFGMRMLAWMMRLFPGLAYGFAVFPVLWYFIVKPEARRAAAILHQRIGKTGGRASRLLFGFRQALAYSKIILDNVYLGLSGDKNFVIKEKGTEILLEQIRKGKGLVMLSAHMGNWHLAVNFLSNTKTHVHLVMDDVRQEEVRRRMDLAKSMSAHLTVHSAEEGAGLVFELSAALQRGEVVIIAGDRAGKKGRRIQAPFLGEPAWFPTAALSLADTVGAPVCAALTFREGARKYTCFSVGPLKAKEGASRQERIEAMLREFIQALETYIRRYPTQWFNFYNFWKL